MYASRHTVTSRQLYLALLGSTIAFVLMGCEGTLDAPDGPTSDIEADASSMPEDDAGVMQGEDMPSGVDMMMASDMGHTPDSGGPMPCSTEEMVLEVQVGDFLETSCAHSGCHLPRGPRFPSLSAADLPALVTSGYLDPDSPQGGLMARIDPDDPARIMPPTLYKNDPDDIGMLRDWLALGAPTGCVPERLVQKLEPKGDDLDQAQLFTCQEPSNFAAGVRRITAAEFATRSGGYLTSTALRSSPLDETSGPYSTFAGAEPLNSVTLSLQLNTLESSREFRANTRTLKSPFSRTAPNALWLTSLPSALRDRLDCMVDYRTTPTDVLGQSDCIRDYVTALLNMSALERAPSEEEIDLLVELAIAELGEEVKAVDAITSAGGDSAELQSARAATLNQIQEGASLMFNALYPSMQGDAQGTLTAEEIAIHLNRTLSDGPLHASVHGDVQRPEQAWIQGYRDQLERGDLQSAMQRRDLISHVLDLDSGYVGGEHAAGLERARPELYYGRQNSSWRRPRRGRYWLAPRIADFFREYFDYADVSQIAKDDPIATSVYDQPGYEIDHFNLGYLANRNGGHPTRSDRGPNVEPDFVDQLDDMIARTIIEAERDGEDVLAALLTARTYRVPASTAPEGFVDRRMPILGMCDYDACKQSGANCCDASQGGPGGTECMLDGFDTQAKPIGVCADTDAISWTFYWRHLSTAYGIRPVEELDATIATGKSDEVPAQLDPAHQARWVELPASERAGVLTHPTWLATHGGNAEADASAVLRGYWIRKHLFCEPVGGLDLVQLDAQLPEDDGQTRARDRLNQTFGDLTLPYDQRTQGDELCSNGACHDAMNSLGMPFEQYNHAGLLRYDDHGFMPDATSTIYNWPGRPQPVAIQNAPDLASQLAADPHVKRCFLRHVFRYFAGRYETQADACVLQEMEQAYSAQGSFFAAVEALYTSEAFLDRSQQGGAP